MFADGDRASLVAFRTASGTRLAWQTLTTPGAGQMYSHVVDATTGRVVYRRNLVQNDNGDVWRYWPGSPKGGTRQNVDFTRHGWLPSGSTRLAGNNTHVWSDVNDDNQAQAAEEVAPGRSFVHVPVHELQRRRRRPLLPALQVQLGLGARELVAEQPQAERRAGLLLRQQVPRPPAATRRSGSPRAAGNFEAIDDDAVAGPAATTAPTPPAACPDGNHIDNANMAHAARRHRADACRCTCSTSPADPTRTRSSPSNGGDEADVVYHEYTHGLSNRLVVDAERQLDAGQHPGRLDGRGLERLVRDGLPGQPGPPARHQRAAARSGSATTSAHGHRPDPHPAAGLPGRLDVQQRAPARRAPDRAATPTATSAGSSARPEVHADGEIWGETLWDLRDALGSKLTESLVTRAMELSPANPSYLDERNAILQADQVVDSGERTRTPSGRSSPHRGMGYFAGVDRRRRHRAGRGLLAAAGRRHADRVA